MLFTFDRDGFNRGGAVKTGCTMRERLIRSVKTVARRMWEDIKTYRVALAAFIIYNIIVRLVFHAFCIQLIITGIPCAGCGMTRAVFYIMTGRFARGMRLNPAAPLWIALAGWFFWNRYVHGTCPKKTNIFFGAVCAVTLAIYVYRMANCFPGEPPMVYYRNNLIRRITKILLEGNY